MINKTQYLRTSNIFLVAVSCICGRYCL